MFKVNDYVVYGSTGVCQIIDITKEHNSDKNVIEYYVLKPVFDNNDNSNLTIKTPINNKKVLIRNIISKDDALSLIASSPDKETIWINDERQRSEKFKSILKSGECKGWLKLIRSIRLEQQEKDALGKKLSKRDEDIMRVAGKNLNEEFAIALNISPNEVDRFILEHV